MAYYIVDETGKTPSDIEKIGRVEIVNNVWARVGFSTEINNKVLTTHNCTADEFYNIGGDLQSRIK